ncbi:hypothetical protein [Campylobacter sp. M4]|uniref:hypothetical protein n=1 Tax=Campylobacter sp. M4 TaxID=3424761 RepID=UPI003D350FDD
MRKLLLVAILSAMFGENVTQEQLDKGNKKCLAGEFRTCGTLGELYQYGIFGVAQDFAKAAAYYRLTCEAGVRLGCHNFAIYSFNQNDKQSAKEYFKKACDLGKDDPATQNTPDNKARWQKACDMHEVLR